MACVTADQRGTKDEFETVPAPETSELAGAARMVVCGITRNQWEWKDFTRAMAEGFSRKSRETNGCGLAESFRDGALPAQGMDKEQTKT